jgi:hypothetical protein
MTKRQLTEMSVAVDQYFYEYPPEYSWEPSGQKYHEDGEQVYRRNTSMANIRKELTTLSEHDLLETAKSIVRESNVDESLSESGDPVYGFGTKPMAYLGQVPNGEFGQNVMNYHEPFHVNPTDPMIRDGSVYGEEQEEADDDRSYNRRDALRLDAINSRADEEAMGSQDFAPMVRNYPPVVWLGSAIEGISEFLTRADYLGIRGLYPTLVELQQAIMDSKDRMAFGDPSKVEGVTSDKVDKLIGELHAAVEANPDEAVRRVFGRELEKLETSLDIITSY